MEEETGGELLVMNFLVPERHWDGPVKFKSSAHRAAYLRSNGECYFRKIQYAFTEHPMPCYVLLTFLRFQS